jgi:hypothetical protein
LSVVRRVNSRSFSLELEKELAGGAPLGAIVAGASELESLLRRSTEVREWLIKSEHGNAGLANRRVASPLLSSVDRKWLDERLAEDDLLVVEPWLPRLRDWCVVFRVPFDRSDLRIHETVCTRDGALIGALFEPPGTASDPWTEELETMAARVADAVDAAGYFGPACVDAFEWRDGERPRLRALVDLNCRLPISDGAYRLWRGELADRVLYYRFFNRRKLIVPDELARAHDSLGERAYTRRARRGILYASPMEFGKLAVAFIAEDRQGIFELERWFRARFEA